jgi:hypothetical protein
VTDDNPYEYHDSDEEECCDGIKVILTRVWHLLVIIGSIAAPAVIVVMVVLDLWLWIEPAPVPAVTTPVVVMGLVFGAIVLPSWIVVNIGWGLRLWLIVRNVSGWRGRIIDRLVTVLVRVIVSWRVNIVRVLAGVIVRLLIARNVRALVVVVLRLFFIPIVGVAASIVNISRVGRRGRSIV